VFVFGWGGIGVWFGLVIGLSAAGILLMARFWMRSIKTVG
jgi:MATE family multidrug resistance protein